MKQTVKDARAERHERMKAELEAAKSKMAKGEACAV